MPRTDVDGQVYQVYVKAAAGNPGQNGDCESPPSDATNSKITRHRKWFCT